MSGWPAGGKCSGRSLAAATVAEGGLARGRYTARLREDWELGKLAAAVALQPAAQVVSGTTTGLDGYFWVDSEVRTHSCHPGILRREPVAGHHLRRIRLGSSVHGLWRIRVGLLELPIKRRCIDGVILWRGRCPGLLLRTAPCDILRPRLEAFRVISTLLICFPFAAIGFLLG